MKDEIPLGSKLKQYLLLIQRKRRSQQFDDILLAVMVHKDKNDNIKEAIRKSGLNSGIKKELINWVNCGIRE